MTADELGDCMEWAIPPELHGCPESEPIFVSLTEEERFGDEVQGDEVYDAIWFPEGLYVEDTVVSFWHSAFNSTTEMTFTFNYRANYPISVD